MYTIWINRTIFCLCHIRCLFNTHANYIGQLVWQQGNHVLLWKHNANSPLFEVLKQMDWLTKRKGEIQEEKSLEDTKWCLEKDNSQNSVTPCIHLLAQIHWKSPQSTWYYKFILPKTFQDYCFVSFLEVHANL